MKNSAIIFLSKNMKKFFFSIKVFAIYLFLIHASSAKESNYLDEGIKLFEKKEFKKSKIFFEKDLVFNPKSEQSYLYLAKIFENNENDEEQEINLRNVLLLNPQNDEAIYMLTILKIKQFDYNEAKELINNFSLVCKSFCSKKKEINDKLEKIIPKNAENNN